MPFTNNSRHRLNNPLTESLFYNDHFAAEGSHNEPLPIETEDLVSIFTEDDSLLLTEGDA